MYYIYENDKPNFWYRTLGIIKIEGNKMQLPIGNLTEKQLVKLAKKTIKILQTANSKKIVLSKKIQEQKAFVNQLQTQSLEIMDGKWLYFMLLPEILAYILSQKGVKKEETTIHILVNNVHDNVIELIKSLAKIYKSICIITKHTPKLQKLEEQIFEETGTIISVMNNKRKSLSKAQFIINIDFPEEFINQYAIAENAIILDLPGNTTIKKKRFNGMMIIDYEIQVNHKEEYAIEEELFYAKDLYEAEFYQKQPYKYVRDKIQRDGVEITSLYGKNGKFS